MLCTADITYPTDLKAAQRARNGTERLSMIFCHQSKVFWTAIAHPLQPRKARFQLPHDRQAEKAKAAQIKGCSEEAAQLPAAQS